MITKKTLTFKHFLKARASGCHYLSKAGGTGLNLTGADYVIHYDPWWNVAAPKQATDRAHRIGQTRQVTVIKMIAKDTIEEKIMKLQQDKKELADAVLEGDGESLLDMTGEELMKLI